MFIGIIDYLQEWDLSKMIERLSKRVFKGADGAKLSAIEPRAYQKRFVNFAKKVVLFD